jgi:hypothetical protein
MLKSMSCPKMAAPGDVLTGYVLQFHIWNHLFSELLVSVETFPKKCPERA